MPYCIGHLVKPAGVDVARGAEQIEFKLEGNTLVFRPIRGRSQINEGSIYMLRVEVHIPSDEAELPNVNVRLVLLCKYSSTTLLRILDVPKPRTFDRGPSF